MSVRRMRTDINNLQKDMRRNVDEGRETPTTAELPEGFQFLLDAKEDLERLEGVLVDGALCKKLVSLLMFYFLQSLTFRIILKLRSYPCFFRDE